MWLPNFLFKRHWHYFLFKRHWHSRTGIWDFKNISFGYTSGPALKRRKWRDGKRGWKRKEEGRDNYKVRTPTPLFHLRLCRCNCVRTFVECSISWTRLPQTRLRLYRTTVATIVTSEGGCLNACRLSATCQVAEWRASINPGCTLADGFILGTNVTDSSTVTYTYAQSCTGKPNTPYYAHKILPTVLLPRSKFNAVTLIFFDNST